MRQAGVLAGGPRPAVFSRNGNGPPTTEELCGGWTCRKRDGTTVPFDPDKIKAALNKCFNSLSWPDDRDQVQVVDEVTHSVIAILAAQGQTSPEVEEVQRLVIQQLWASNLFDAAEHYQNHREQRRQARLAQTVPPAYAAAVAEDAQHFKSPIQVYQFQSKFARWSDVTKRRETWREACDRIMGWFHTLPRVRLTDAEWAELDTSLYEMETCCAMRVVQMAGPALERCHVGVYNCAYTPLRDLRSFSELLYVLMSGGGCGFSVEDRYVSQLPRVKRQKVPAVKHTFTVPDTTEGWCDALLFGLERWFDGEDVWFETHLIRKKNMRLKTKGGRSSGPEPLIAMLAFARNLVLSRQGKVLSDLDCHDLACMIGKIVQVGGVRRAATISFSDLDSVAMRDCKSGNWYERAVWRTMANNTAVYECRPDIDTYMTEMAALIRAKSGERGILSLKALLDGMPARRERRDDIRGNPCMEIQLRPCQFCDLSIVIARPWDTEESLTRKVRLAAYWGCMQKTATDFKYLRPEWKQNCEEEALIGVDISGHADCRLLRFGAPGRAELLQRLRKVVNEVDAALSARFGINRSAADTCVKPAGDSSVFFNCASGCSPWFGQYIMRWAREPADTPVAKFLIDEGVPYATAPEDPALLVFGFPREAPPHATLRCEMTALDQLNNWLEWKENWAEHTVSCTVYVSEDEWPDVLAWVYHRFDKISGLSFFPRDNGIYAYAPNEELTYAQYQEALAKFPTINWAKLCHYEHDDMTQSAQTPACIGGACDLG